MSTPTFYLYNPPRLEPGDEVSLAEDEAGPVRALRVEPGEPIRLTDGRGGLRAAGFRSTSGDPERCRVTQRTNPPGRLPVQLVFGVANESRTPWLVEKAVELGVLALQPVEVQRSRSVADAGRSDAFCDRASRRAVAALKQCGGARLPEIAPVRDLHDALESDARPSRAGGVTTEGPDLLLRSEAERPLGEALTAWDGRGTARLLIGPEGGLTDEEVGAYRDAGFRTARLGERTLRFETAAVAALAVAGQRVHGTGATVRGTSEEAADA